MFKSEYCDVNYNEELNVVFVKWKKFCFQNDYRNPLYYALEIMKNHNDCHYVADTRDGFENEKEDTEWLFNEWLSKVASLTTCKIIFFIINKNNNLKKELEGQSIELKKMFDVIYCFGLNEVKEILKKQLLKNINISKKSHLVEFNKLLWNESAKGVRFKVFINENQQIRLVEFSERFIEQNWCEKGHAGYVLNGNFSTDYNGIIEKYIKGDVIFIPKGENNKHKVIMEKGEKVSLLLFEIIE